MEYSLFIREYAATSDRPRIGSVLASSSIPCVRSSPAWMEQRPPAVPQRCVGSGSVVVMFSRRMSNAATDNIVAVPGGWYLMPISYCLPSIGLNGVLFQPVPDCGSNDSE
ncbi:hypothetical protein D3C87_1632680 [compost metagenome]